MSSWKAYVDSLMEDGCCQDAAIVGYTDARYVWASHEGGIFSRITPEEIAIIVGSDRTRFLTNGLTLGCKRCSVIRDSLCTDADWTMDLRTKSESGEPTYNISIGKGKRVLVMVMGNEGVHGGNFNKKTFEMIDDLRKSGY